MDAALVVSVLHHLSTLDRRRAALAEIARCLRPGATAIVYVWAFEQPNGRFPSQDLLVPWKLYEHQPLNGLIIFNRYDRSAGRIPPVLFHRYSTREQRIIRVRMSPHSISNSSFAGLTAGRDRAVQSASAVPLHLEDRYWLYH
jgi:SAM-dependent methyltransferase